MGHTGGDEDVDLPEVDGADGDSQDRDDGKMPDLDAKFYFHQRSDLHSAWTHLTKSRAQDVDPLTRSPGTFLQRRPCSPEQPQLLRRMSEQDAGGFSAGTLSVTDPMLSSRQDMAMSKQLAQPRNKSTFPPSLSYVNQNVNSSSVTFIPAGLCPRLEAGEVTTAVFFQHKCRASASQPTGCLVLDNLIQPSGIVDLFGLGVIAHQTHHLVKP
ncbi:hypothetical protein ACRRTK_015644 [Alexandromys fortis]